MTTKAQTQALKAAFRRFVELMEPLEDVHYVVAVEPMRPDIFTFIRTIDDDVMKHVFSAQNVIHEEFPDILIDFHVRFLEGRPLDYFLDPLPELTYSRLGLKTKAYKSGHAG